MNPPLSQNSHHAARPIFCAGLLLASVVAALGQTSSALSAVDRMQVPAAVARAIPVGRLASMRRLPVSISLAPRDPAALEAFVADVSDPKSPNYRKFLTPAQVGQRFGVSEARLQAIIDYLKGQGLSVTLVGQNRMSILAEGTVAQTERAFDTTLRTYRALPLASTDRSVFYSYTETPSLPASFASSVLEVGGLENSTRPIPRSLTVSQTRSIYKATTLFNGGFRGEGRNLAISNFDGFRLSNLPLYYGKYNLPAPSGGVGSNVKVVVAGTAAGPGAPQGEGDLDIQMVLGVAPLCNLTIYDGNTLIPVLTREVNDNVADIISESWGWQLPASTAAAAHNLHLSMSAQGITYMAASGDYGTNLEPYSYPDYEPEVLQVGGTIATSDPAGNRTSEIGWSGSGGGYSTNAASFNVRPSWQKGTGVPTTINKRLVPDVALNAAGTNGAYPFYYNGALSNGFVGTSFASPVLTGLLGLAEQKLDSLGYFGTGRKRLGRLQDAIYAQNGRSDVWYDVVSGANGNLPNGTASKAGVGWDSVTGWGAMDIEGFVAALAGGGSTPPPGGPTTYHPTGASVFGTQGIYLSGNAASLRADDASYHAVGSTTLNGVGRVASTSATFALPAGTASATITLNTNGPSGSTAQVFAYNATTGAYDLLASAALNGVDKTIAVSLKNAAKYLSTSGTMTIVQRSIKSMGTYTLKTDQIVVTVP